MANELNDVIVADDDPLLVSVLFGALQGEQLYRSNSLRGFAALTLIRERVPDILISDLNMPRMSGFELLSIVRRRFPSIGVIAMSGADSGVAVPQGTAADAFYAKGSSSVDRFFEILYAIKDEATRRSLRAAAPIWIPLPIDQDGLTTIAVACPECLRTFPHCLRYTQFLQTERCCPHCRHPVQLAIVRPTADIDQTGLGIPAKTVRVGVPHIYVDYAQTTTQHSVRMINIVLSIASFVILTSTFLRLFAPSQSRDISRSESQMCDR